MPDPTRVAHLTVGETSVVGDGGMRDVAHWGAALPAAAVDPQMSSRSVVGGGQPAASAGVVTERAGHIMIVDHSDPVIDAPAAFLAEVPPSSATAE